MEPADKVFENTFAESCTNHTLTVGAIIVGLGCGAFKYAKLPKEVRDAVNAEMDRRRDIAAKKPEKQPALDQTWKLDILDASLVPWRSPYAAHKIIRMPVIKRQSTPTAQTTLLAEPIPQEVRPLALRRRADGSSF